MTDSPAAPAPRKVTLYRNGSVYTAADPFATAMLVDGDTVAWVGSEQAATSSNKNLVTRALGVEDAVLLEVNEHKVEPGDVFLMCSDGLSDMVDDEAIARILATDTPLEQRVEQAGFS